MKFIISVFITAFLSYAFGLYAAFPWYTFAICALAVALAIHQKPFKAFLSGFIALFLLWGILAMLIDNANNHILSQKVAQILPIRWFINGHYFINGTDRRFGSRNGCFNRKFNQKNVMLVLKIEVPTLNQQ